MPPRKKKQVVSVPNPAGMGAPKKVIVDWTTANALASFLCTGEEIASTLGISYDTLELRVKEEFDCTFPEYIKRHSGSVKASLRRKQIEAALAGNTTMLIWTGKQLLGQKEPDREQRDFEDDGEGLVIIEAGAVETDPAK